MTDGQEVFERGEMKCRCHGCENIAVHQVNIREGWDMWFCDKCYSTQKMDFICDSTGHNSLNKK